MSLSGRQTWGNPGGQCTVDRDHDRAHAKTIGPMIGIANLWVASLPIDYYVQYVPLVIGSVVQTEHWQQKSVQQEGFALGPSPFLQHDSHFPKHAVSISS